MEFADPNLKLTVIEALREAGLLPGFDKAAFYRKLGEDWDHTSPINDAPDPRVLDALLATELPRAALGEVTTLVWDGGNEVFADVWTYWDGEDQTFDVADLAGIEQLPALEALLMLAGSRVRDLSALAGMARLRKVIITGNVAVDDLTPLLDCPSLAEVDVPFAPTATNARVVEALRARGVLVGRKPEPPAPPPTGPTSAERGMVDDAFDRATGALRWSFDRSPSLLRAFPEIARVAAARFFAHPAASLAEALGRPPFDALDALELPRVDLSAGGLAALLPALEAAPPRRLAAAV